MPFGYTVYVRHEVYLSITDTGDSSDQILRFIESLASNPFHEGDLTANDSAGREYQVKIVGGYAVYYWSDHVEKEVRIVDLIESDTF